jgi:hypothetical protein
MQRRASISDCHSHEPPFSRLQKENLNVDLKQDKGGDTPSKKYFNERVEQELIEFKVDIEKKFEVSMINKIYSFPRTALTEEDYQHN